MRSAHGGGFLYALALELGIKTPDIMVGSSGSAGNTFYFVTGQYENGKRIWLEHLSTPKFISPLRFWRIMDVDYLVDTVCKKQEPLDINKLKSSPIDWHIPITDYETGSPRYVSADDGLDPFEILRATTALPVLFSRKIFIGGKRYVDGETGPRLEDHIAHAIEQGATKILVLNDVAVWTPMKRTFIRIYAASMPHAMHDAVIRDISPKAVHIHTRGVSIISMAPHNLAADVATRDPGKLRATFEQGVQDCLALKGELRALFSE